LDLTFLARSADLKRKWA
ncbi:bacterial regulatory helix-turn-helix, lysR family protein, partial [Vibrio parahaemolyticus V-223/04]